MQSCSRRILFRAGLVALVGILLTTSSFAASKRSRSTARPKAHPQRPVHSQRPAPQPRPVQEISYICLDADTGLVILENGAEARRAPASMVKMILMLLVAEGLEQNTWALDRPIAITPTAQAMGGSQLWLKKGDLYTLDQLMFAVAVASANDAAVAVAEGLWGNLADYLTRANARAAELGMTGTVFHTANGLPGRNGDPSDETTARDMATLARACVRYPAIFRWTSQKQISYGTSGVLKNSTNKLLFQMPECDGLKTGWTGAAGFCITATARRDNIRLIAVTMGCPNNKSRFETAQRLLEDGFSGVRKLHVVSRGDKLGEPVLLPSMDRLGVQLTASEDLWVTVRAGDETKIEVTATSPRQVPKVARAGDVLGEVRVSLGGQVLASAPLRLPQNLLASVTRTAARSE